MESSISGLINRYQELAAQKGTLEEAAEGESSSLPSQPVSTSLEFKQQQEQLNAYQMKLESANQKVFAQSFCLKSFSELRKGERGKTKKELMRWILKADR